MFGESRSAVKINLSLAMVYSRSDSVTLFEAIYYLASLSASGRLLLNGFPSLSCPVGKFPQCVGGVAFLQKHFEPSHHSCCRCCGRRFFFSSASRWKKKNLRSPNVSKPGKILTDHFSSSIRHSRPSRCLSSTFDRRKNIVFLWASSRKMLFR